MTLRLLLALVFSSAGLLCNPAIAQDPQPEYQLGPGDSIRVVVFQNPDLTVETRVTENGTISYPLIGSLRVGGLTIPAAELAIARALEAGKFIERPQVNIVLVQNRGNQVSVLGAVNRAGRYPLETFNTRLSEIVAIAGGISAGGADIAIVTGTRNGKPLRREIDIAGMFLDNQLSQDLFVAGGDVIYVHRQPVFYIYGEVQRPGSYRLERAMTVRQALAQSGGPTARGTVRGLRIFRRDAARVEAVAPELDDAVKPDDVLFVQESLL